MPLARIKAQVLGRDVDDLHEEDGADPVDGVWGAVSVNVPGSALNLRAAPYFNPNVLAEIPHGVSLIIEGIRTVNGREWLQTHL